MKKLILLNFLLSFVVLNAAPDGNYVFRLESATQAEIDSNMGGTPQSGMLIYNSNDNKIYYYNGTQWILTNGINIYDSDGVISADREVDLNNHNLNFMNGNIGIGTANPIVHVANNTSSIPAKLELSSSGRTDLSIFSDSDTSNPASIFLQGKLTNGKFGWATWAFRGKHTSPIYANWVDFAVNDGATSTKEKVMRMNMLTGNVAFEDSNVSIGTSNVPKSKLLIVGLPSGSSEAAVIGDTSGHAGAIHITNEGNMYIDTDADTNQVITKVSNYSLTLSDNKAVFTFDNTADMTLTIPAGLPIGYNVSVYQINTGKVTIVGSGTTVLNRLSRFRTAGKDAGIGIVSTATDTYHVTGDLKK